MTYKKEKLIKIFNYIKEIKEKEKKIEEWMAHMFEDQFAPFINYSDPIFIINLIDEDLWRVLDYMFYEMSCFDDWIWNIEYTDTWLKLELHLNSESFIKYCDAEGLLENEE
jgi:hypothetical protein